MHTPSPAAGTTPPRRRRPRRRWFTWPRVLYAAPVAVTAVYGAWWIALHAGGGRAAAHPLWQSLAIAETLLALLLPGVLVALCTVAATRPRTTMALAATAAAAAIAAMPYLHGDPVSLPGYLLPRLAAAAIATAAGTWLHARRETASPRARPGHRAASPSRARHRPGQAGGSR